MENARKIATNTFSQVGAKFVIAALQVLIFRAITGYLGKVGYGQYTAVYEFAGLFTIAADFGLFTIGVARIAGKAKAEAEKILSSIFTLRILLVLAVTGTATVAALLLPAYTPAMRWGVLIAALANGSYLVMLTISSVLQVQLRMTRNAIDQVLGRVLMLVLVYAITKGWTGDPQLALIALFSAGFIGNVLSAVLTAWSIRRDATLRLNFQVHEWRDLLSSSLPYGISLILGVIYLRIGTPLLNHFATDADVGLYGLGLKMYDLIVILPFAFMNSVLPALARNLANRERLSQLTQYALEFLAVIGFGALAGVLVLADGVVAFLAAGQDFSGAEGSLRVMMVAMVLNFFISLFSYLLLALRRERELLAYNAVAVVVSIGVNLWFLQLFAQKSLAVACAVLVPQLLVLALTARSAVRRLQLRLSLWNPLKVLVAAALMGGSLWWMDSRLFHTHGVARLVVGVALGGALYLLLLLLLRAVHPDALDVLLSRRAGRRRAGPITIGLDVRSYHSAKTGKEWYTVSIIEALLRRDTTSRYLLYTKYPLQIPNLPPNATVRVLRVPIMLWHLAVVLDLWRQRVDVWLATASYIIPALLVLRRPRCVVVVHDLVAFLNSKRHLMKAIWIERITLRLALFNSERVVAVSRNTAADLRRAYAGSAGRTVVVPEAARSIFRRIDDAREIRAAQEKYHLPRRYLLFVGTLEPRKNLPRLIQAYAALPEALRATYDLVHVGRKGWNFTDIFQTVQQLGVTEHVHFAGYVPDEDLPAILNGAELFVLPSLYEGFGLPLLEAFACGTPVVCSDTPALVEVAGEGCITFPATDVPAMTAVLERVLGDASLRDDMSAWGTERAASFSWDEAARAIHELLVGEAVLPPSTAAEPATIAASEPGAETS